MTPKQKIAEMEKEIEKRIEDLDEANSVDYEDNWREISNKEYKLEGYKEALEDVEKENEAKGVRVWNGQDLRDAIEGGKKLERNRIRALIEKKIKDLDIYGLTKFHKDMIISEILEAIGK